MDVTDGIMLGIVIGFGFGTLVWIAFFFSIGIPEDIPNYFERGYCAAMDESFLYEDYDTDTFFCIDDEGNITEYRKIGATEKVVKETKECCQWE